MAGDLAPSPLLPAPAIGGSEPSLIKVDGVWVHQGVPQHPIEWDRVIDDVREARAMLVLGWNEAPAGHIHHGLIDGRRESLYRSRVPTLSIFFGIEIRMYFRDHAPPHFHAFYHDNEVLIDISTLEVIRGWLPRWDWFWTGRNCAAAS